MPDDLVVLADVGAALGEGPTWDPRTGTLRWVDIDRGHVWSLEQRDAGWSTPRRSLDVGPTLGAAVPAQDGGLLLARTRYVEHRDRAGRVVGTVEVVPASVASRLNDGACDPAGRFVVGSLALHGGPGDERLWRLEDDGTLTVLDDDLTLSNGIGWSPDGGVLYVADTYRHVVFARTYDAASGRVGPRHVLVETPGEYPDGLCVDAAGDLWVAFWSAGQVRRYSPDGELVGVLRTGAPLTTSCAFVGDDLGLLVVTTAAKPVPGVPASPRGGALLACRPGGVGRPQPPWRPVPPAAYRSDGTSAHDEQHVPDEQHVSDEHEGA
ncbi:calcium-binding protein [Cellulomonas composti]|uniref:Calcium-binding protein n=1 Tax=Cellulomonas composti TaxID=266130 RepID=A0A511J9I7_9CELL|nr:calcium-binding protein [Cellulomonas composti]